MTTTLPDRDLLARLVSFPSVSGGNDSALVAIVCEYLSTAGVSVEQIPSADGSRANILATVGPPASTDRAGLTLCGHLDVVPADEPDWTNDPFTLTQRDGRLFGRGACDMKAFVAIAINQIVRAATRKLTYPLVGVFTFDEELGSLGAQQFAKVMQSRQPIPADCIIGEPTSLRPVRMHKGHLKLRITITGKAAHSGSPHLGVNAIEPAGEVITRLAALARAYASNDASAARADASATSASIPPPSEGGGKGVGGAPAASKYADFPDQSHTHPPTPTLRGRGSEEIARAFRDVPFPVLCVARIRGGEALNVIPERCDVDVGVRLMPGMCSSDAIERIHQLISDVSRSAAVTMSVINDNPPMLCQRTPLVEALHKATDSSDDIGVSYASDAGVLQRDLGMRCVLFGPGSIEVAHRPDEFVPIDEFEQCGTIVTRIVHEWCEASP